MAITLLYSCSFYHQFTLWARIIFSSTSTLNRMCVCFFSLIDFIFCIFVLFLCFVAICIAQLCAFCTTIINSSNSNILLCKGKGQTQEVECIYSLYRFLYKYCRYQIGTFILYIISFYVLSLLCTLWLYIIGFNL